jgi:hypothetical protein
LKTGTVLKTADTMAQDLSLINKYTRKELTQEEVYTFTVVLCDNDIDRDYERFTVESLFSLQELFLGKTGITNHNPVAENQSARIYQTYVEAVEGKKTATGDDYFRLVAKAYVPRCEGSKNFIDKIDTGILKEVSVGCSVGATVCSICGEDINSSSCSHRKGQTYGNSLCFGELVNPKDAYEWSFVAVPAQRSAGVIKSFLKGEKAMDNIIKALKSKGNVTLNEVEKEKLVGYINSLEKEANDGRCYREGLMNDVKRFALLSKCGISTGTMESIVKSLSVQELSELRTIYEKQASSHLPLKPQTYVEQRESKADFKKFTI